MYPRTHFPSEFVSISEKRKPEYGIAYARAAFYAFANSGVGLFYNGQERYQYLTELAQGRQSIEPIRKRLGYQTESNRDEQFAYIDINVLNYAQKYINYVQGKLNKLDHEVSISAIDPVAQNHKMQYESRVKAFYELRDWVNSVQLPMKELFSDLDIAELPDAPDEWLIDHTMNYQHKAAMEAEIRVKKLNEANNYAQIKKLKSFDLPVYGIGITNTYLDKNGIPRIRRIHPANFICSVVKDEFFGDMEYAGHIEYITTAQFRREASPFLTEASIKSIIDQKGTRDRQYVYGAATPDTVNYAFDNLTYIPVFRFQYLTEDTETYEIRPNRFGNLIASERENGFEPIDTEKALYSDFGGSEREIVVKTYTAKYGGTWVIDSDVVYDYGRTPYLKSYLVEPTLDYHVVAPNMKDGVIVSLLAQMEEPLELLNLAYNKIKQILADGFMGAIEIDIRKLESIPLGKGGANMTPRQVMDLFFKKKILFKRSSKDQYDQVDGAAIIEHPMGLTLADYLAMMQNAVGMLDTITGINREATQGQQQGDLVQNTKYSFATTEIVLDYLTNAMQQSYRSECMSLLRLSQISEEMALEKGTVSHLKNIFGYNALLDGTVAFHDYSLSISAKPTMEEWQNLYDQVNKSLTAGLITFSDAVFVRRIDNLKQAEQVLIHRERKRQRELAAQKQADIEANARVQQESNQQAMQNNLALLQEEYRLKFQLEQLLMKGMQLTKEQDFMYKQILQRENNQAKLIDTRIQGNNDFVRQAQKNKVEYIKVDKRPDRSPED